ncbi:MAG TPA: DMT family transporter [Steroidobacteraceae bacterium]
MARALFLTCLAMLAFAANSVLCRIALLETSIDPATFTTVRISSGAIVLSLLVVLRGASIRQHGRWLSALALFVYAIAFSFAYESLSVATGALLLFGAVQATMIGYGWMRGERFTSRRAIGMVAAIAGLITLLLPGVTAPPVLGALLMLAAGVAWGCYSLRGSGSNNATAETAGNFVHAVPFAIAASVVALPIAQLDKLGVLYAIASGVLASGIGYAIWYAALPGLTATSAATVQLLVPALAAFAGIWLLDEQLTLRLVLATVAILGGIALVVIDQKNRS